MDFLLEKPIDLFPTAWRRIKTKVGARLSDARRARLIAERCRREMEYKTKAEQCYSEILQQILPMQQLYLPAISQVRELSCFRELLDPDRDVQPAEWEQAAGRLPESLSEWMIEHRNRYISLLPIQVYDAQVKTMEIKLLSDPSIDLWRQEALRGFAGQLELATAVFRHPTTNRIMIGRDACHAWKMKGELEFVERGAAATYALVRELQLDPATTTPSMLEQLNRRFICTSCPTGGLDQRFRSWKSCVGPVFSYSCKRLDRKLCLGRAFYRVFGNRSSAPPVASSEPRRGGRGG